MRETLRRMNDAQLSIGSLDAVDIRLDVAGAGSRAYAFLIDWHIRVSQRS